MSDWKWSPRNQSWDIFHICETFQAKLCGFSTIINLSGYCFTVWKSHYCWISNNPLYTCLYFHFFNKSFSSLCICHSLQSTCAAMSIGFSSAHPYLLSILSGFFMFAQEGASFLRDLWSAKRSWMVVWAHELVHVIDNWTILIFPSFLEIMSSTRSLN